MLLVGLTGNIAAGKSTVATVWQAAGVPVLDADAAARAVLARGTAGADAVRARFGDGILTTDGDVDRAALGRLVFSNPAARRDLEAIVHPRVSALRAQALAEHRARRTPLVVCDVPLLYEAHLAWEYPRIVLVDAPEDQRVARLMQTRGMTEPDARARVRAQLASSCKRIRADIVIDNHGTLASLDSAAREVLAGLQAEAAAPLVAAAPAHG